MILPDNKSPLEQTPEQQNQNQESGEQKIIQSPETPQGSVNPQPVQPVVNDDAAAQSIANNLQNAQPQAQPQANAQAQNPPTQSAKNTSNTDPYIKAAENVIEKDKNDPYQEEEDHEDVQVKYLKDRFGKEIKKG